MNREKLKDIWNFLIGFFMYPLISVLGIAFWVGFVLLSAYFLKIVTCIILVMFVIAFLFCLYLIGIKHMKDKRKERKFWDRTNRNNV